MNKTKKVAWHKHLKKDRKLKEKLRQSQKSGGAIGTTTRR